MVIGIHLIDIRATFQGRAGGKRRQDRYPRREPETPAVVVKLGETGLWRMLCPGQRMSRYKMHALGI